MFTRILVPLDGSLESNAALPAARTTAVASGASVFLLQVLESPESRASSSQAADKLMHAAAELAASDLRVDSAVRPGQPADEIVQQVGAQGADLVIMRTRGQSGIQRALTGSVAERLLSRTDVPIMMLRASGRQLDRIAKLLVPVDGSPGGALALASAVGLAKTTGAQIRLMEVVVPMMSDALAPAEYDPRWDDEALEAAETYVDGMVMRLRSAGVVVDGQARRAADVPGSLAQAAAEHASDLIVMSTHALTGLKRAVLGSVADAVMRTAPCPVLLIRRRAQEN